MDSVAPCGTEILTPTRELAKQIQEARQCQCFLRNRSRGNR